MIDPSVSDNPYATPDDPWFQQFNPANASPTSPLNGGGGFAGGANQGPVTGAAPTGQSWDQNYFATNFGTPKTPQELIALESKIVAAGGKVLRNASGVAGKIQTPDGRIVDVINAAGAGGNGFQWLDGGGSSAGHGSSLSGLGYSFGDAMKPFTPPTAQEAMSSPGVEFALAQKNRLLQGNAAARGISGNYRAQEAIGQSLGQSALGLYGDIFNRSYQTQVRNTDAPFDKSVALANLGAPK